MKPATKQKIIDSFWSLYENTRIEKITVREICTNANINRSTFYEYFSDVYSVLEHIEDSLIPSHLPEFDIDLEPNNLDIKSRIRFFNENRKYLKVLLSENGNPSFRFKVLNTLRPMISNVVSSNAKNFDFIAEYALCGLLGVLTHYVSTDAIINENEIIETITNLSKATFSLIEE